MSRRAVPKANTAVRSMQASPNTVHLSRVIAGLTRNPWMPGAATPDLIRGRHDKLNSIEASP